jgi:hypothetical protein
MKILLKLSTLFLVLLILNPKQAEAQVKAGLGAAFASDIEQVGVQGDLHYQFANLPVQIGGSLVYYIPKNDRDFLEANLNGSFIFYEESMFKSYLYAGLYLARSEINNQNSSVLNRAIGMNVGVGAEYDFGPLLGFGDLKYVTGEFNQPNFAIGLRLPF